MSKKKINAPLYTEVKFGISSLINDTRLPNGWLYANGRTRTRFTPEDLPDTYLHLMFYATNGYIRMDGIKDMVFKSNYQANKIHREDYLYISYSTPIKSETDQKGNVCYYNYDVILWNENIALFIRAIQERGFYDTESIAEEVIKKERYFLEKNPEAKGCM